METVLNIEQFKEVKQEDGSVMMFTAGWCPDCTVLEPDLPALQEHFPEFNFYKVDRDQFIDQCQELDIYGIPSFLVFKKGKEVHRFVSKDRKSKDEIIEFLNEAKEK
ncbi:thioredoxin family protein [Evansella sp. LMS18]|jgi:thiol-disulfide isomerase/thioredoxin|uniref:thioredoxin family protein n=1 Tax=Evansella sp. LMS18 TaxID=2924033 RepID=UPI0020D1E3A8|nr:thioredoxin family protein [Evansella sp. LMS18]UTR11428.1 thioredoxin family protein [Evansella sp. LMS18]